MDETRLSVPKKRHLRRGGQSISVNELCVHMNVFGAYSQPQIIVL